MQILYCIRERQVMVVFFAPVSTRCKLFCLQCVDPVKMAQIYKALKRFSRYPVFTLRDVGKLIKTLVRKYNNEVYQAREYT